MAKNDLASMDWTDLEAEARLTQARMNMTMPERLQSYPPDMFDIPPDRQIVRGLLR